MEDNNQQFKELDFSQTCAVLRSTPQYMGLFTEDILQTLFADYAHSPLIALVDFRHILVFVRLYELNDRLHSDFASEQSKNLEPPTISKWIFPVTENSRMVITMVDGFNFDGCRDSAITGVDAARIIRRAFPAMRPAIDAYYGLLLVPVFENPPESIRLLLEALQDRKLDKP
jgi:hypothetical protein